MLNLFRLPFFFGSSDNKHQPADNLIGGIIANYYKQHKDLSGKEIDQAHRLVNNEFQNLLRQSEGSPDQHYERISAVLRNIERDLP